MLWLATLPTIYSVIVSSVAVCPCQQNDSHFLVFSKWQSVKRIFPKFWKTSRFILKQLLISIRDRNFVLIILLFNRNTVSRVCFLSGGFVHNNLTFLLAWAFTVDPKEFVNQCWGVDVDSLQISLIAKDSSIKPIL